MRLLSCFLTSYSDEIVPSESSFSIKSTCVELRLKKTSSEHRKALKRPQHSPGITVTNSDSSQLTNHIQKQSATDQSECRWQWIKWLVLIRIHHPMPTHMQLHHIHSNHTTMSPWCHSQEKSCTPQCSKTDLKPTPLPPPLWPKLQHIPPSNASIHQWLQNSQWVKPWCNGLRGSSQTCILKRSADYSSMKGNSKIWSCMPSGLFHANSCGRMKTVRNKHKRPKECY